MLGNRFLVEDLAANKKIYNGIHVDCHFARMRVGWAGLGAMEWDFHNAISLANNCCF